MLNTKSDRDLFGKLGLTEEELSKLRAWTMFDDPKEYLTEEIVRLAMEDYRTALVRKVTGDPVAEEDSSFPGLPAPPSLAAETAYVNNLVSSRLAAMPAALLASLRAEAFASRRSVTITVWRVAAALAICIAIAGGLGIYVGKRQALSSVVSVESRSASQYQSVTREMAQAMMRTGASRSTDSVFRDRAAPTAGFSFTKTNEISVSSEPAGATVILQSGEPVVLGTTPTLLEVYTGPNDVSYIAARSRDDQLAPVLVQALQSNIELTFEAPKQMTVSRTLNLHASGTLKVQMATSVQRRP